MLLRTGTILPSFDTNNVLPPDYASGQNRINPVILHELIALIGKYNHVRSKATRLKTPCRIKLTKFVDRGGSEDVDAGQIENVPDGIAFAVTTFLRASPSISAN
jgi:hypothetical protein